MTRTLISVSRRYLRQLASPRMRFTNTIAACTLIRPMGTPGPPPFGFTTMNAHRPFHADESPAKHSQWKQCDCAGGLREVRSLWGVFFFIGRSVFVRGERKQ